MSRIEIAAEDSTAPSKRRRSMDTKKSTNTPKKRRKKSQAEANAPITQSAIVEVHAVDVASTPVLKPELENSLTKSEDQVDSKTDLNNSKPILNDIKKSQISKGIETNSVPIKNETSPIKKVEDTKVKTEFNMSESPGRGRPRRSVGESNANVQNLSPNHNKIAAIPPISDEMNSKPVSVSSPIHKPEENFNNFNSPLTNQSLNHINTYSNTPMLPPNTSQESQEYSRHTGTSNSSLDISAESLPSTGSLHSPPSETFCSTEDDPMSPRKERRHRDGGKKKKKDKDKDKDAEGGRKKKKHHHRDKQEMASEMVSLLRLKVTFCSIFC